jgi:hypothetical protein
VSLAQTDASTPAKPVDRAGQVRNPFKQLHVPKPPSTTSGSRGPTTPGPASSTPSTPSGAGGGTTPTPAPAPAPKKKTPNKPDPLDIYRVWLTFGTPGNLKQLDNLARLTPLPSLESPFFVFLGVKSDGATTVFMVDSDATPTGDGKCIPSTTDCEQIEMKAGDTEFFDMTNLDGTVTQYTMHVRRITRTHAATAARAARAHRRKSKAGAAVVASASSKLKHRLQYSFKLGVLLPVKHPADSAHVSRGAVLSSITQAVAALPVAAPAPVPAPAP